MMIPVMSISTAPDTRQEIPETSGEIYRLITFSYPIQGQIYRLITYSYTTQENIYADQ